LKLPLTPFEALEEFEISPAANVPPALFKAKTEPFSVKVTFVTDAKLVVILTVPTLKFPVVEAKSTVPEFVTEAAPATKPASAAAIPVFDVLTFILPVTVTLRFVEANKTEPALE